MPGDLDGLGLRCEGIQFLRYVADFWFWRYPDESLHFQRRQHRQVRVPGWVRANRAIERLPGRGCHVQRESAHVGGVARRLSHPPPLRVTPPFSPHPPPPPPPPPSPLPPP